MVIINTSNRSLPLCLSAPLCLPGPKSTLHLSPLYFSNYFHFLTFPLGSFCEQHFNSNLYDIQLTLLLNLVPPFFCISLTFFFFYYYHSSTRPHHLYPRLLLFHSVVTLLWVILYPQSLHTFPINPPKAFHNYGIWNPRKLPLLSFVVAGNNLWLCSAFLKMNVVYKGMWKWMDWDKSLLLESRKCFC